MSKFVKMHKGDETLSVHPDTVASHEAAGWSVGVADEEDTPAESGAEPPDDPKTVHKRKPA